MYCLLLGILYVLLALVINQNKDNVAPAVVALTLLLLVILRIGRATRRLYLSMLM
jgi:hypothetical protein